MLYFSRFSRPAWFPVPFLFLWKQKETGKWKEQLENGLLVKYRKKICLIWVSVVDLQSMLSCSDLHCCPWLHLQRGCTTGSHGKSLEEQQISEFSFRVTAAQRSCDLWTFCYVWLWWEGWSRICWDEINKRWRSNLSSSFLPGYTPFLVIRMSAVQSSTGTIVADTKKPGETLLWWSCDAQFQSKKL